MTYDCSRKSWRYIYLLVALVCSSALSAHANPLDDFVENTVRTEQPLVIPEVQELFNHLVLTKELEEGIEFLQEQSNANEWPVTHKAKAVLAAAHLQWRAGNRESALAIVDNSLAIQESTGGQLLKSRILDASGKTAEAIDWYAKVVSSSDMAEREIAVLRLAMIDADEANLDDLLTFAQAGDQLRKNRVATVLAILGHPQQALELYQPIEGSSRYVSQLLRQIEWSIAVEDFASAQESAWQAYDQAETGIDRLYALSLLEEAYQKGDALTKLLEALDQREPLNEELRQLQIDQFVQLEDYDQAIALYGGLTEAEVTIAARDRLLKLYALANRNEELEAEYLRLLDAEPQEVQWYVGLASHYLLLVENAKVEELWQKFADLNSHNADVLIAGAEAMLRFGLEQQAIESIENHLVEYEPAVAAYQFLFSTHLKRGRENEALDVIQRLEAALDVDSKDLRIVADAYEQLSNYPAARDVYLKLEEAWGQLNYDERNRLAWLQTVSGNRAEALDLWKDIWVSASSPARRTFAESQLLLLAAELNKLGDLVYELEQKLFEHEANRNELNLLVRIYTEVGDTFSATEVIEEYARWQSLPEIELKRQLAATYLQMLEIPKYDEILRELADIDAENRVEHIQNIILNLVTLETDVTREERFEEIQYWVERLRNHSADAVNSEFLANVLAMSGYVESAIENYQNALIEQPTHSDNLLLMADLMKENDRTNDAVNMLQYIAEHTTNDNEFVVAIDGIINMIGQTAFGAEISSTAKRTFRWAFRIILERIATREDKIYLYTLLADLAQEISDKAAEYTSLEHSVALAGLRRPAILRELFTMATPGQGFSFLDRNVADPVRQLTYGQRLIGLRQQLPPSVFIELSKTLLDQGEIVGAERALEQINDITGMIDIPQTKADLFYDAGYTDASLQHYIQAEVLDQNNLELAVKAAVLRELVGQKQAAHDLYLAILERLLLAQPVIVAASQLAPVDPNLPIGFARSRDQSVTHEYRDFYELLVQGAFTSFSGDEAAGTLLSNHARDIFDQALESSESNLQDDDARLELLSRLKTSTSHAQRIAFFLDDVELSEYVSSSLQGYFDTDAAVADRWMWHQKHWLVESDGSPSKSNAANIENVIDVWTQNAIEQGKYEVSIRFALQSGDLNLIQQQLRLLFDQGNHYQALAIAAGVLDEDELKRFANTAFLAIREQPMELLQFIARYTAFVLRLEEKIDTEIISIDDMIEHLSTQESKQRLMNSFDWPYSLGAYIFEKGSTAQKLTFMEVLAPLKEGRGSIPQMNLQLYARLITEPLDEQQRTRLRRVVEVVNSSLDYKDQFLKPQFARSILLADIPPENVAIHNAVALEWVERGQLSDKLLSIFGALNQKQHALALDLLLEYLNAGTESLGGRLFYILGLVRQELSSAIDQKIDNVIHGESIDLAYAQLLYGMKFPEFGYTATAEELTLKIALLERLIETHPEETSFRIRLILANMDAGSRTGTIEALGDYYHHDPTENYIRAAYFINLLDNELFTSAITVIEDGRSDLRDPNVLTTLEQAVVENRNVSPDSSAMIFKRVAGLETNRISYRSIWSNSTNRSIEKAIDSVLEDQQSSIGPLIVSLWRKMQFDITSQDYPPSFTLANMLSMLPAEKGKALGSYYSWLQDSLDPASKIHSLDDLLNLDDAAMSRRFLDVALEEYPIAAELQTLFLSMPEHDRSTSTAFLQTIGKAYARDDRRALLQADLLDQLETGSMNSHEFLVWMMVRLGDESKPSADEIRHFSEQVVTLQEPTLLHIYLTAQLFSKFEQYDLAAQMYLLAAAAAIADPTKGSSGFYSHPSALFPFTLLELCNEIRRDLPSLLARDTIVKILEIANEGDTRKGMENVYNAFVLDVIRSFENEPALISLVEDTRLRIEAETELDNVFQSLSRLKLASYHASLGDQESALALLRPLFSKEFVQATSNQEDRFSGIATVYDSSFDEAQVKIALLGVQFWPMILDFVNPTPQNLLINGRVQLIEGLSEQWYESLVDTMFEWLDDDSLVTEHVGEWLLAFTYELHQRNHAELAADVVSRMSSWVLNKNNEGEIVPAALYENISRIALELDLELPLGFVAKVMALEVLDHTDEVQLLKSFSVANAANQLDFLDQLGEIGNRGYSFLVEYTRLSSELELPVPEAITDKIALQAQAQAVLQL